eukprot:7870892-Lingulodinium_polyedra.AAC.1
MDRARSMPALPGCARELGAQAVGLRGVGRSAGGRRRAPSGPGPQSCGGRGSRPHRRGAARHP